MGAFSFIKLPFVIKTFVLSLLERPFYTGFTVVQAFRFMVGPGHCPMISKYGQSLSKAVGPVDPSFLVVKKTHFNKNIHLQAYCSKSTNSSKQKVHVGCQ